MIDVDALGETYRESGFVSSVPILSTEEAATHRKSLEDAEAQIGPLHYVNKIHTVFASAYELVTHPVVLDIIESIIGPDVLLYNSNYIIKEPGTGAYLAWHQDLTYWGLDDDDAQISMWLALSPATAESGCMVMMPGTHADGRAEHVEAPGDGNVLLLGQQIVDVDESLGVHASLDPGQASFHHGWTIHRSAPNVSDDRRIGLNVQYVAPHNAQDGPAHSATLVRGEDRFGHYDGEPRPKSALDVTGVEALLEADREMKDSFQTK